MSLARRIAHNTIIQFAGKIIGTVLGLLTVGIMTRYLGQAGFGYYTTITGFLQFFGILVDFGLTLTTAQMLGHSRWDERRLFANILSLRIISAIVFLGIAPLIGLLFPYPTFVKVGIAVTTLSFFFMSLNQIFLGFFQKHLELTYVSIAEVANRLFLLLAIVACVWLDLGLLSILVTVVLSNVVQFAFLVWPAHKIQPLSWAIDKAIWRDIWQQTWPIALSIALNLLYLKTDILVLSVYSSPEEVGLYGAAYKVVDVLTTFPVLFAGILLPLLSRFWQSGDKQRFAQLTQQGFDAMSIIAWPIVFGTLFVGSDVMAIVAGEAFRASGLLLQLLIWASAVIFFNAVFAHAIVALQRQRSTIWAYAITAIVGVAGYLLFIPKYGALGAAVITIVSEALVAILVFAMYTKFSGILPSLKRWLPIFISCALMSGALFLLRQAPFMVKFSIAVAVYSAALLATGGISKPFLRDLLTLRKSQGE